MLLLFIKFIKSYMNCPKHSNNLKSFIPGSFSRCLLLEVINRMCTLWSDFHINIFRTQTSLLSATMQPSSSLSRLQQMSVGKFLNLDLSVQEYRHHCHIWIFVQIPHLSLFSYFSQLDEFNRTNNCLIFQ